MQREVALRTNFENMKRLLFFLLCLAFFAAPFAAWAYVPSASPKAATDKRSSSPVDLSRPPRVITPEIISHLREAAKARGEKTAAAFSGLGKAHAELLSRVAALSASTKMPNEKRVGDDGGREMMRSVLEAAAAKEGRGSGGAEKAPTTAAAKMAALAARGAASASAAAARSSKRPTVTVKTVLPPASSSARLSSLSPPLSPPAAASPLWMPKPVGGVWKRLASKKSRTKTRTSGVAAPPRKEGFDEL